MSELLLPDTLRPTAPVRRDPVAAYECPCGHRTPLAGREPGNGLSCAACGAEAVPCRRTRLLLALAEVERDRASAWEAIDNGWAGLVALYARLDALHAREATLVGLLRREGVTLPESVGLWDALEGGE